MHPGLERPEKIGYDAREKGPAGGFYADRTPCPRRPAVAFVRHKCGPLRCVLLHFAHRFVPISPHRTTSERSPRSDPACREADRRVRRSPAAHVDLEGANEE